MVTFYFEAISSSKFILILRKDIIKFFDKIFENGTCLRRLRRLGWCMMMFNPFNLSCNGIQPPLIHEQKNSFCIRVVCCRLMIV